MAYDELGNWMEEEDPDAPKYPGFKALRSSDGSTYYVPSGERVDPGQTGTSLSQDEIPIPFVSLPNVPKEDVTPQKPSDGPAVATETSPTVYDVTPPETVPETPAEQLQKLLPEKDPFEAVAERVRRRAPPRPPEETPPPPPSGRDPLEFATAPIRMGAAKFLEHPGNLLYGIPAALTGLLADIEEATPKTDAPISGRRVGGVADYSGGGGMRDASKYLKELAEGSKRGIAKATLTEGQKPATPIEQATTWMGEYAQPTKNVSAVATMGLAATGAAIRGGMTGFSESDVPIPKLIREAGAAEDPFKKLMGIPEAGAPVAKGQGQFPQQNVAPGPPVKVSPAPNAPKSPAPLTPGSTIVPMPPPMPNVPYAPTPAPATTKEGKPKKELKYKSETYVPEGMVIPPPDQRVTKPPNLKQSQGRLKKDGTRTGGETDEQFAKRFENAWIFKEVQARMYSPTAAATFQSVNGMQRMPASEYRALAYSGAALVGVALSGIMFKKFYTGKGVPNFRPVENAAPGTMAISTKWDLARVYDDINASLRRIGRRAGIDREVVDRLMQTFRIQTRNGGRALADSAIMDGRMETPSFRFIAPMSLKKMGEASSPQSNEYLKLWSKADDLTNELRKRKFESGEAVPTIEGQTISDVVKLISDMEKANPALKDMQKANQGWNTAIRSFLRDGEYSTLTKEEFNFLQRNNKNRVGKDVDTPIASQANEARRLIKERLDNEAIGKYVDEMRKVQPSLFVRTSKEELEANPTWATRVVKFKREGKMEYYTSDPHIAAVLKTDHHVITGLAGNTFYTTKRILESTTTGNLAPQFSVTSAIRSYWIAKFTTEKGFRAPTAVGSVMAIPQQLIPQIAKSISNGLDRGSAGMLKEMFETGALGQFIGSGWMDGLSKRLAVAFEESVYAQLKRTGSHRGSVLEQLHQSSAMQAIDKWYDRNAATSNTVAGARHFWNAWKASIEAVHSSVSFNYVKRNIGRDELPSLAERARRLTGDPRTGGEMFVGGRQGGREIPYESNRKLDQLIANTLVKGYGYTLDAAREAIPWWNPTLQGVKRLGEAWAHDPIRFSRSVGMYAMAPAAGLFYFAKSLDSPTPDGKLGGDPNGRSYVDYCISGRNAYNSQMNFCIPLPGRPVEDSVELTFFHELNPFRRAMEISLHHMLGGGVSQEDFARSQPFLPNDHITSRRSLKEDMMIAAHSFLDTAVIPPMPPIVNFALGTMGIRGPQGIFGGDAYAVKSDPFNQNGGLNTSLEIASRALMGGIAESLGQFYANTINSTGTALEAVGHGAQGAGATFVKKTPILRDITHIMPDRSNNTDMTKEVFEHQKEFNDMARFYKKWTVKGGAIGTSPASAGGEIAVTEQLGLQRLGPGNPGLQQPDPDNPMYIAFMQKFYDRFMKESPNMVKGEDKGGIAFKSMWRNYGRATQKLERLKDVNYGTYARWQEEMEPAAREELETNGIDTTDRREVVNFYRRMQFDALRVINYTRRSVEQEMSEEASAQAGKPVQVRLKDIQPFLSTMQNIQNALQPAASFMFPDLLQ
jgi:hypothetical protein